MLRTPGRKEEGRKARKLFIAESVELIMLGDGWCTVLLGIWSGDPNLEKGKW